MGKVTEGLQLRICAAIYYSFVFALAIHRCVTVFSGRLEPQEPSHLTLALFAGLTLGAWWLSGKLQRDSDRIAAILYGAFYAVRIGTSFARGTTSSVLGAAGAAIISAGMIAMVVGVIHAISHKQPQQPD